MKNIYLKKLLVISLFVIGLLLVACVKKKTTTPKTTTPITTTPITGDLVYSDTSPYIFPIKTAINNLTSSGVKPNNATVAYSIKPNLPLGLNINPTDGTISGTPSKLNPETPYTITATGTGDFTGSITNTIKITIKKSPITGDLVYSGTPPYKFPIKTAITPLTSSGIMPDKATVAYSINPNLPPGLNFNPTDGTISGTPSKLNPETPYTITATGTGDFTESITKNIKITIKKLLITGGLVYSGISPYIFPIKTAINDLSTSRSGIKPDNATVAYSIKPDLPSGLNFNHINGTISGTPTKLNPKTSYTITAIGTGDFTGEIPKTINIKIDVSVITLAGSSHGFANDKGTAAQFFFPYGIALDSSGNIFVVDSGNHKIRKITSQGVVSTFAGSGSRGSTDGRGADVEFKDPSGIAVDSGNIFVADTLNHKIRKTVAGVTFITFAGSSEGDAIGQGTAAQFNRPYGIALDSSGNIFVADTYNHKIRKITPQGEVSTFAGSSKDFADGKGTTAKFNNPKGIAVDNNGNIFVADSGNHKIRKITSQGVVSTFAGRSLSEIYGGFADGKGTDAKFALPSGIAVDSSGNVFVADSYNHKIRKITPQGEVSTLAGSSNGFADGKGTTAKFETPSGIAVDNDGNILVTDLKNHKIRKIIIK
jgi:sugar lactone lactonase YvrE